MGAAKLIVASVRLPVSVYSEDGRWDVRQSPGGLATALRAVAARRPFTWIGYPGVEVPPEDQDQVRKQLAEKHTNVPIFLEQEDFDGFYGEASNRVLWPLFHNLPGPKVFDRDAWERYRQVNQRFADAIVEHAEPGDTVWVHDYQLMLVPEILRRRQLDCAIGFFLHIPFPSSAHYRTLPCREEILRGMLGADLIGFHTYEYVDNFRRASLRVLGLESEPEHVRMPSHDAHLGVLPIGIEPDEIHAFARTPEAIQQYDELVANYAGKKVVLGVDRLDYTKGLPQKLLAFEELLCKRPELRDQVVLIQVAAPSRQDVVEYQSLQREINEMVGRINGAYGTLSSTPIHYINRNVPRQRLAALYKLADVALVTPVRDGMNMVCLEYIAARGADAGVLILSEFAGAAACLSGARVINPYNPGQIAEVLAEALDSGPNSDAFDHMREFVHTNTSLAWAKRFLQRLEKAYEEARGRVVRLRVNQGAPAALIERAKHPLILLDYDGTLVEHTLIPAQATPSARVRELIGNLARIGHVYVISGRPGAFLDQHLGDLPIGLSCEHGLSIKPRGGAWAEPAPIDRSILRDTVEPLFRQFTERTPGAKVELKKASIAWHYRGADPKLGAWRAKELRSILEGVLSSAPYSVLAGDKVIEVRHVQMSKGHAARLLLERHADADAVICCGNDRTDEEMFEAILRSDHPQTLLCRVGGVNTLAPYMVPSVDDLLAELEAMVAIWQRTGAAGGAA